MKRFLSLLLSIAMLMSGMGSLSVMAAEGDVVTEYGEIPSQYQDAQAYPFAVFSGGEFLTGLANWTNTADPAVGQYLLGLTGKSDVQVLMRRNYSIADDAGGAIEWNQVRPGNITIDLGGYKLTNKAGATTSEYIMFFFNTKPALNGVDNTRVQNVTIKNGGIDGNSSKSRFLRANNSSTDKTYILDTATNVRFENIDFTNFAAACTIDVNGWSNTNSLTLPTGQTNYPFNVAFKDCSQTGTVLPYSGTTPKTMANSTTFTMTVTCEHGYDDDSDPNCNFCGGSDSVELSQITMNGEAIDGLDNHMSVIHKSVPFGTESVTVAATPEIETATVSIDKPTVTEFPTTVKITVTNSRKKTKTYTLCIRETDEHELTSSITMAKDNADSIISMTYDDGNYNTALFLNEQFAKYNLKGSIMMNIDKNVKNDANAAAWQAVYAKGYLEPQNHSATHLVMPSDTWLNNQGTDENGDGVIDQSLNNTPENYQKEIIDAQTKLETYFPWFDIIGYAPGDNTLSDGAMEVVMGSHYGVRQGIRGYQDLDPTAGTEAGGWYNLKMYSFSRAATVAGAETKLEGLYKFVDDAVANKKWLITLCHSIKGEGANPSAGDATTEEAEQMYARISEYQEQGKIWSATFGEAIKYVRERQISTSVAREISENKIGVSTSYDSSLLPSDVFDYPLTVKVEMPEGWSLYSVVENGVEKVKAVDADGYAYVNAVPNGDEVVITKSVSEITGLDTVNNKVTITSETAKTGTVVIIAGYSADGKFIGSIEVENVNLAVGSNTVTYTTEDWLAGAATKKVFVWDNLNNVVPLFNLWTN